jgi:hypothetical protein
MAIIFTNFRAMKFFLLSIFFLFSLTISAKKAPKWKGKHFKTSPAGIRYNIKKPGNGDSIQTGYGVKYLFYTYDYKTKKNKTEPGTTKLADGPLSGTFTTIIRDDNAGYDLIKALVLLRKNGEGYFIVPQKKGDSTCYYIKVEDVFRVTEISIPRDTARTDSVNIIVDDPGKKFFGDTLFSFMKLVEVPQMADCGITAVNIAFKFEMSWFDNGVQRKQELVFIECPELYGKDFFEAGKTYMITCVPMTDNFKQGHHTLNNYPLEKLDIYYGLRIRKMQGN